MTVAEIQLPQSPTTTELLRTAGTGDPAAWDQLVRRFEPAVAAMIRTYRLQDADARDAAQGTWLLMIERYQQVREPEALAGWLTTTARRECLRIVRDRRRVDPVDAESQAERPDATCDTEQRVVDADTAQQLRQLMRLLPARSRVLLSALFEENPPAYAELSRRVGIPVGSIGPTRARALHQLRVLIEAKQPGTHGVAPGRTRHCPPAKAIVRPGQAPRPTPPSPSPFVPGQRWGVRRLRTGGKPDSREHAQRGQHDGDREPAV